MSKVAIVTGAGRGIGRACAVALAGAGYELVLVSRTESDLAETRRLCGRGEIVAGDVAREELAAAAVARAVERFGTVSAAVHCAGLAPLKPVTETTAAEFEAVIGVNLGGAFHLARAAWPVMKRGGGGRFVAISSMSARDPFVGFSAYAAAKGGVNALVLALDREGRPDGIRAFAVAPGAVETGMFRALVSPEEFPAERTLTPEAVASVVLSCLSGPLQHSGGETIYLSKS